MKRITDSVLSAMGFLTQPVNVSRDSITHSMFDATREIHKQTERGEFAKCLAKGTLSEKSYLQYLSDLYMVYHALEIAMSKQHAIQDIYVESLSRTSYLEHDIAEFNQPRPSPSAAACEYAAHLEKLAEDNPRLLMAHAYVLYGGNLSGGVIIKKWVDKAFPGKAQFYNFDDFFSTGMTKETWKLKLDSMTLSAQEENRLHEEAHLAFQYTGSMQAAALHA